MTYSKKDVAGVVVLYNSTTEVIANIHTYSSQIDKLFVIDNSDVDNASTREWIEANITNVYYLVNNGNQGVAFALNRAANQAVREGYSFLLTMDDDSSVPPELIDTMLTFTSDHEELKIGILSVNHSIKKWTEVYKEVLYTMTSGNLLNLAAYQQAGPFLDALFIDHVDHEYGLRLNKQGFKVIEMTDLNIIHRLGTHKQIKLGFILFSYVSHSSTRIYYKSRNGVYVARQYVRLFPAFALDVAKILCKDLIKIIFFEDKKRVKLESLAKGLFDGFAGRLGAKRTT